MKRRCATCWKDPITSNWHNPDKHRDIEPRGTSESNWICQSCIKREANQGWTHTPSQEVYGIETEHADDTNAKPDSESGPFETATCIEIMRRYCLGQTQRGIASDVGCQLSFVIRTIKNWRKNHAYFVETLKKSLSKKGKIIQ